MLKIKGWLRAAALCVAFCLLLTGCSIPMPEETVQVEELLRAPRLAGDYGALQTALNAQCQTAAISAGRYNATAAQPANKKAYR